MNHEEINSMLETTSASTNVTDIAVYKRKPGQLRKQKKEKSDDKPDVIKCSIAQQQLYIRHLCRGLPDLKNYDEINCNAAIQAIENGGEATEIKPYQGTIFEGIKKLERTFEVYNLGDVDKKVLIEIRGKPGTAHFSSQSALVGAINSHLEDHFKNIKQQFSIALSNVKAGVESYLCEEFEEREMPPMYGFKSYPGTCFNRLSYDPIPTDKPISEVCPWIWKNLENMRSNDGKRVYYNDFLAFVGMALTYGTNRKQSLWIAGKKNAGKSKITKLMDLLFGSAHKNLSEKTLFDKYGGNSIAGKRVITIKESTSRFLNTSTYKSLTGDDTLEVNEKNKPIVIVNLDVLLIFLSNDPPKIPNDEAIKTRLITIHIQKMPRKDRVDDTVLLNHFQKELPYFAYYALQAFKAQYRHGKIIPTYDGQEDEETGIDLYNETAQAIFDAHFVKDPTMCVASSEIMSILRADNPRDGKFTRFVKFLKDSGMQRKLSSRTRVAHYEGMRKKTLAEIVDSQLNKTAKSLDQD